MNSLPMIDFMVVDWKCIKNPFYSFMLCYDQIITNLSYLKGWIKVGQFSTFEIDVRQWRPRPRYGKQHHKYEKRPCQRSLRYYIKEVMYEYKYTNTEAAFCILLENLGFLNTDFSNGLYLYKIT